MALGDGTGWDEANPTNSSLVSSVDDELRDLRIGIADRLAKEHEHPATSGGGGEHKQGSAISFVVADATERAAQTTRPDGSTALDSDDEGRLLLQLDTKLLYYWSGSAWVAFNANTSSFSQVAEDYILLEHKTSAGSNGGGDFTSGAWRTRPLTDETYDAGGRCSLNTSTDQFTLTAGTYRFRIRVPAYKVGKHVARLRNASDTTYYYGTAATSYSDTQGDMTWSEIVGRFTIASTKTFDIQHRCETTKTTNGMGLAVDITGVENIFTQAEFWREVA